MNLHNQRELEELLERDYGNTTGIVVQKGGETVYEHYFSGFTPNDAAHVFSVTKSVISALIGIAIDRGYLESVHQRMTDFFPAYAGNPNVTIKHLLTMTAPFRCEEEPYEAFFSSGNWVRFALNLLGDEEPPAAFRYTPIVGVHILSGILAKATGRGVLSFANEHLFSPLQIPELTQVAFHNQEEQMAWYEKAKHPRGWVIDPKGIPAAGWGLTLTPTDMAKLGQLYLSGGWYGGKRVVSSAWIQESTMEHSRWGELSYGYLWWILNQGVSQGYAAVGDAGNVIYINPRQRLVVAMASLFQPDAKDRFELIRNYIEPMFKG